MCVETAFRRGGLTILRQFTHAAEPLLPGLNAKARARFAIGFKYRKFVNGRTDPSLTFGSIQLTLEFKSLEAAYGHFQKK